jgi:septum formation protein
VLILASSSPRRRQLLSWVGLPFDISVADIDETPFPAEDPGKYTLRLASAKAMTVAGRLPALSEADLILASDTTVSVDGDILGKPLHAQEARTMLTRLRGRTHQVFTAVALLRLNQPVLTELCVVDVPMRRYSADEMETYIATGDPLDKAGAYAIQHSGFHPVEGLGGCYAAVMGLPLCHVLRLLAHSGLAFPNQMPQHCRAEFAYDCPVARQIYQAN